MCYKQPIFTSHDFFLAQGRSGLNDQITNENRCVDAAGRFTTNGMIQILGIGLPGLVNTGDS